MSTIKIENEIIKFIAKVSPKRYYIGITNDIRRRFVEHGIIEKDTLAPRDPKIVWIHRDTGSEYNAKSIEKVFLDRLSGKSSTSLCRDKNPTHVYIYTPISGITNKNI